jgi:hypothetical protein
VELPFSIGTVNGREALESGLSLKASVAAVRVKRKTGKSKAGQRHPGAGRPSVAIAGASPKLLGSVKRLGPRAAEA